MGTDQDRGTGVLHERTSRDCIDPRVFNPIIAVLGREEALELLRSLTEAALASWPKMQQAHAEGREAELGRMAHKLAGSCGSLGALPLEAALRNLERACRSSGKPGISAEMARIPGLIHDMCEDAERFCDIQAGA